jgi:cytochrome c556
MKIRLLPYALALLLGCAAPILAFAQEHKHEHKEPETELGNTMDKMNGAWRKLKKQVADPASNAGSLELVATISAAADKALTFTPARAADVPAADRAKFTADYQAQMKDFIAQIAKLGAALKANDNAAAAALVQKMGAMQKEGHKEFKRPDM